MPTNFLWGTGPSSINLLANADLASLANGSGSVLGAAIDNSVTIPAGWQLGTLSLLIGSSSLAFTTSSFVSIYFLPSDGAGNYPNYTNGAAPKLAVNNYWAANISIHPVTQSASVVRETVPYVAIPPFKFKTVLINNSGVTLPATGNSLDLWPAPTQY